MKTPMWVFRVLFFFGNDFLGLISLINRSITPFLAVGIRRSFLRKLMIGIWPRRYETNIFENEGGSLMDDWRDRSVGNGWV